MSKPIISVVLACYREPLPWFQQAIESVLNQSFSDIELIVVVDDPANDSLRAYLATLSETEDRLVVVVNPTNLGLPASLNKGIAASSGQYIARMDADDICHPDRLKIQLAFLTDHPEVSLVGSDIELINESNETIGAKSYYQDDKLLRKIIPYSSVTCHPTWLLTRALYDEVGGYRELNTAQDYDFLYRTLDLGRQISNVKAPLLRYRVHQQSITGGFSLNRYKIRHYIHKMHQDRMRYGHDSFDKRTLQSYLDNAKDDAKIIDLLAKLRQTKSTNLVKKSYYLAQLFLHSKDIRTRVYDHLKLKTILALHKVSH